MSTRSPVARRPPRSLLLAALLSALTPLAGCAIATPFRAGALRDAGPPGEAVLVSFTHARLKAGDRSTFDRYVQQVFDGMQGSPGLLASSIRRQLLGREVWTFSVWASKEDLVQFVRSPQHREAIAAASAMLETFETRRRVLPREKLPGNWDEALALFAEEPGLAQRHALGIPVLSMPASAAAGPRRVDGLRQGDAGPAIDGDGSPRVSRRTVLQASARPSRALGMLLAALVSWQATGFTAAAFSAQPVGHCCCRHEGAIKCACPVCTHAQESESPQQAVRPCGGPNDTRAIVAAQTPSLPAIWPALSPLPGPFLVHGVPAPLHPSASPEVPTPPPLA